MGKEDILSKGAILQRDQETYAITVRLLGGVMDVETGRRIANIAEKYDVEMLKVTGDGRMALFGLQEKDIDAAYEDLGLKAQAGTALCQQYIKICPGSKFCNRGQRDTIDLARKIDGRFYPYPKISSKIKIGIAGCFNSCAEPAIKDIGLIGLPKGWVFMVGGAGGKESMIAETIARDLSDEAVLEIMDKLLQYYRGVSSRPQTRNLRLGVILKKEGKGRIMSVCGLT